MDIAEQHRRLMRDALRRFLALSEHLLSKRALTAQCQLIWPVPQPKALQGSQK
jgi:hypothetical protein